MTDLRPYEEETREQVVAHDGERLTVKPYVRVLRSSDDEIVVRHGTRSLYSEVIADATRNHVLGWLLDRLRTPATTAELALEAPDKNRALDDAIAYLRARRVVVPATEDWRAVYFDTFHGRADGLGSHALGVAGDGALARRVCRSVAVLGPEAIVALDDSPSGYPETVVLRPPSGMTALTRLFGVSDFVAVVPDRYSPALLHSANEVALATGTPWMCACFDGHEAVVGPAFVPGQTCCYAEFETQAEASLLQINEALLLKEDLHRNDARSGPLPPHHADVAGGFAVDALIRLLLGGRSYAVGRSMRIDFERASVDYQDVLNMPRCPACQHTRSAYRHVFMR